MHRMLSAGNPSWKIVTLNSFLILLNLQKDLSPGQLATIKLRNKGLRVWMN